MSVSVIIPARNEAATLAQVVASLKNIPSIDEIIVVDDGSTDATGETARAAGAVVVRHAISQGNGAAVKTGLRTATAEFVVILDADGQHSTSDVERLLAFSPDCDLVVGARSFRATRLRDFGNLFLRRLATLLTGRAIPDLTSGLRRLRRKTAFSFFYLYPQGFSFPATTTILFLTSGYAVDFIPIENKPRPAHASQSKLHPFRDGFKFLAIIYRVVLLSYPLRFFFPVGLILLLLGFAWTVRTMMLTAQVSAAGALALLSGLTLILFGTIADQLSQIRKMIARASLD